VNWLPGVEGDESTRFFFGSSQKARSSLSNFRMLSRLRKLPPRRLSSPSPPRQFTTRKNWISFFIDFGLSVVRFWMWRRRCLLKIPSSN